MKTEQRTKFIDGPTFYLRPKANSRFMKAIGLALRLVGNKRFMERYWTTIGRNVYYPTIVNMPMSYVHQNTIDHELVHVRQWEDHGLWLWLSYLLLPLPFGLAWYRWRWEREAYLEVEIKKYNYDIEQIVETIWCGYAWPWPRARMSKWFHTQAGITRK